MGTEVPWRALLLGLVEVRQPLEQLDVDGRARLFGLCHAASVAGDVDESGWLGWLEHGLMGVEVTLDKEHLHVTSNEILVGSEVISSNQVMGRVCLEAVCCFGVLSVCHGASASCGGVLSVCRGVGVL